MRKAKISLAIITTVFLFGFIYLVIHSGVTTESLNVKTIQLQSTEAKLRDVNLQLKTQTSQQKAEKEQLLKEKQELEAKLQAKLEAKAKLEIAAQKAEQRITATSNASAAPARTIVGSKLDWLRASGIPESDWTYVDFIVGRESGWNPCAYNPGKSDCNANPTSACGLAQSLPCGKQSGYGHWTDPVANLKWQHDYVNKRYGGYQQAYAFWTVNKWY